MKGHIDVREKVAGGIPEDGWMIGPAQYAQRIARYITDASTVRARTLDQYGRAPSLDQIRKWQAYAREARAFVRRAAEMNAPAEGECPDFWQTPGFAGLAARRKMHGAAHAQLMAQQHIDAIRVDVITARDILQETARAFGYSLDDLVGKCRDPELVKVRHFSMWVLTKRGRLSQAAIGRLMNRDHSSVIYGVRQFESAATPDQRELGMKIARMGMEPVEQTGEAA